MAGQDGTGTSKRVLPGYTLAEACAASGKTPSQIRRLAMVKGMIRHQRIGKVTVYHRGDVAAAGSWQGVGMDAQPPAPAPVVQGEATATQQEG